MFKSIIEIFKEDDSFDNILQCDKLLFSDAIEYSRTIRKPIRVVLSDRTLILKISSDKDNEIIDYDVNWKDKHIPVTIQNYFI